MQMKPGHLERAETIGRISIRVTAKTHLQAGTTSNVSYTSATVTYRTVRYNNFTMTDGMLWGPQLFLS